MYNQNNVLALETFLVAAGNQALYNTAGAGNHINNNSTGAVRLANNQLGIFSETDFGSVKMNIATDATPTVAEAPMIYVAQGTADSANPSQAHANAPHPLFARPFERSGSIAPDGYMYATKQLYVAPSNSIWVIGEPTGGIGNITALDNTEYALTIAYKGRFIDSFYHAYNTNVFIPSFTTPNYTDLGTVSPIDHLVQNLVWNINRNSRVINASTNTGNEQVVAMALDLSGGVGTLVSGLTAGFLPLVNTPTGLRGITITAADVAMLIASLPTGSSIVTVDLTTAGGAVAADAMAIMALDRVMYFDDRVPHTKTDIEVTLRLGFDNTVATEKTSFAQEGQGTGRWLWLEYRRTHNQRKYNLNHDENPIIEFPNPVNRNATYVTYRVRHENSRRNDSFNTSVSPQMLTILVPSGDATTIAQLDTALTSWLSSAGSSLVTI